MALKSNRKVVGPFLRSDPCATIVGGDGAGHPIGVGLAMPKISLSSRLTMRATPALLNLARMLALPALGLHQAVREELDANPALEEVESQSRCSQCGDPLRAGWCPRCAVAGAHLGDAVPSAAGDDD